MKQVLVCIIAICCFQLHVSAQYTTNSVSARHYAGAQFVKGRVLARPNDVEEGAIGSPYLNPDWGKATVFYADGRSFSDIELQYNLMNNELYFRKAEEIFLFTDTVRSFDVLYTVKESIKQEKYQSGYPSVDNQTANNFYQVISDGPKVQLIKNRYVKRNESYHYSEGKKINYFHYEDLYLYDVLAKQIVRVKKGDTKIAELLPNYSTQITAIQTKEKLKLKNIDDLMKLVSLLNQQ